MQKNLNFETTVHGKWILAGEHAVLRGHPEIIFPVKTKQLTLKFSPGKDELRAEFCGEYGDELQLLFWGTFERAIEILNIPHDSLSGKVFIESNIPVGAGMGASAAICVAIGRWLVNQKFVPQENLLEFARQLENLFHGESSGADIAVAIAGAGIYFSRSGGMHPIKPRWKPQWYLSFSDKPSATSRCVKKVKDLWRSNTLIAQQIDLDMADSVRVAETALQMDADKGLKQLTQAIQKAHHCFKKWGLCEGIVENHILQLTKAGAIAAKPTGAGDGGFVLSLWKKKPPKQITSQLISV